jgi:hypothetical protein
MDNILFSILVIIIIIIIIVLIISLLSKYSNIDDIDDEMHSYNVNTPAKANGKNMNYCLPGCVRGTCKENNNNNNCKYDFQCQYCQDKDTNMFYVNFDNERTIVPLYEEERDDKLNNKQESELNESIKKNNIYINQLNHKIDMLNK